MFKNKLIALDYYSPDNFEYLDEQVFRNFISWLENQKIRLYKVEERIELDAVESKNWPKAFEKYLNDIQLTSLNITTEKDLQIEKLLSYAIRLEYSDSVDKYNASVDYTKTDTKDKENPLEKIDYTSDEFKAGLIRLQQLLNIPSKHEDTTSVLQAISYLISQRLNTAAVQAATSASTTKKDSNTIQLALSDINLGFDTNDQVLNDAAKILRLMHIKELRDLQTQINETIVSIQNITANPKTDTSLGRVGR